MIKNPIRHGVEATLESWRDKEKKAVQLLQIAGKLRFDKSIDLVLFRHEIYDTRPSELLNLLKISENYASYRIPIDTCLQIAQSINAIHEMPPARIDIGTLALSFSENQEISHVPEFVDGALSDMIGLPPKNQDARDVILYGFGRIGRLATRILIDQTGKGEQLRLKAIVIRPKLKDLKEEANKRASLLRDDSVHGTFHGQVDVNEDGTEMIINGNRIQLIYAGHPSEIDYTEYGIHEAIVIDNTGVWRDETGLSLHLRPGVRQVVLTAPGKGNVPNIVYGINESEIDLKENNLISAASCTTNAIVPVLSIIQNTFGIVDGHIETIHAYTNDQNLIDNFHKKPRRGRGAPLNLVLTTTGAATAVGKVIPQLEGKLTGNAVRVPTPNVSIAILNLSLENKTSLQELNELLKENSLHGPLVEQLHYSTSTEYVSTNAIGMTSTSVVDAPSMIVSEDGKRVTIYLWYDNEYGYTCQVVRLAKHIAHVRRYVYY